MKTADPGFDREAILMVGLPGGNQVCVRIGDDHYVPVFGLKVLAGRNLESRDTSRREALVNQAMLKQLGIGNPADVLNKDIRLWDRERMIVGIIRDFNMDPLSNYAQPAVVVNEPTAYAVTAILSFKPAR